MAFVKAKREKVEIKICYAGCSGAGKSFSELKRLVKEEEENGIYKSKERKGLA